MAGFTIGLALLDFVPVVAFGIAIVRIGSLFGSKLFIIGAMISLLAGIMKAGWKLILGISGKDVKWMNKAFVPLQSAGFLLMILAVILNIKRIHFGPLFDTILAFPQVIFFALWFVFLDGMFVYRKLFFKREDAKCNWIAEIINSIAQVSLMIGTFLI